MSDILDQVRALGAEFTPELIQGTAAIYAPIVPRPTPELCTVTRDVAYGPDPRHRLDVFTPKAGAGGRPVVAFVHGGGFVGGDKGDANAPFYNHLGAWAAGHGFVGVTITYRLAPDHKWPSGVEDIAAAIGWVSENIAEHGGDPGRVVLWGQSAGAAHVAGYVAHPDFAAQAQAALDGVALCSGVYDVATADRNDLHAAYYGEDPAAFARQSALEGLAKTPLRLFVTVAENDPRQFHDQAAQLVSARVAATGRWPTFLWLQGHNHVSPVMQVGSPADTLGPMLAALIARPEIWT